MENGIHSADKALASTLRELRRERGLRLSDVSKRTGIPISTLSKVENGKLSLSYDKLLQLSRGLKVDISRLFASPDDTSVATSSVFPGRRSFNRRGEGQGLSTPAYEHIYLAADLLNKRLDPIIAEVKARTLEEFGDWVRHPGEEFAFVIEGEVDLHTEGYAPLRMSAGDSVYFDSSMGHAYLAVASGPCRVLSVCTSGQTELLRVFGLKADALSLVDPEPREEADKIT